MPKTLNPPPPLERRQNFSLFHSLNVRRGGSPSYARAAGASLAFHALLLGGLIVASSFHSKKPVIFVARNLPILIAPPLSVYQPTPTSKPVKKHTKGGGGAGTKEKTEETRGHLPALALSQLAPPMIVREEKPQLTVTPTIVAPPELRLQSVALPDLGNPLSGRVSVVLSNGPGGHSGIGSGSNNGVGPGEGTGVGPGRDGGYGDNRYSAGDLEVTAPVPKYAPEPEFSEEARRLKYQGVVTLAAVIGTDGRPHNLRVVRSLGMGLDEKALEKAKTWLFEPGKRNGRPVAVNMYLEVNFRLF